ncbi:MAG: hypothetical protein ACKOYP_04900 [Bacteroidota bacterium]
MKMKLITNLALSGGLFMFASCSSPLDRPFNRETAESDFTRIVKLGNIDSTEAAVMAEYMVDKELIGTQVLEIGATYRDILEQAQEVARERAEQREAQVAQKLQPVVVPKLISASLDLLPRTTPAEPYKFRLLMENVSGKRIRAVKGKVSILDPFGDAVHVIDYRMLDPLEPGEKIERIVTVEAQQLNTPNRILDFQRTVPLTASWESVDFR